jgi:signal transduction histidine kinase
VGDIARLARQTDGRPMVAVQLPDDVDQLRPAVGAALYRIAQESVTNAIRHARNATRITVDVVIEGEEVRLLVRDDGEPAAQGPFGYGLVGIAERARLLGGSFRAGPAAGGGWMVDVVLPARA